MFLAQHFALPSSAASIAKNGNRLVGFLTGAALARYAHLDD